MASFEDRAIDLAREADFAFGALRVSPSQCKACTDDAGTRVEPRVMEVLILLRRSAGETVTRDELIEACWSGRAVSDDAVSRSIGKVRHLGRLGGAVHFTVETVPKVGFRLIEVNAAAPSADHASAKKNDPADASPGAWSSGRAFLLNGPDLFGLAVVVAAIGALLFAPQPRSTGLVEVEAFAAATEDAGVAHVAGKIDDAIAHYLPGVSILANDPPSSPFRWPFHRNSDLRLSGQVDRSDDRIVVSARISEQASGVALWSGEFERPAAIYRGLEEGAGLSIAAVLKCALTEQKAAGRRLSTEVLSLWLRTCDASIRGAADSIEPARALMAAEPRRAAAHAMFAMAASEAAVWDDLPPEDAESLRATAAEAATRALELDPSNARAQTALGVLARTFVEEDAHLKRALHADPDWPPTLVHDILFLRRVGRLNDARKISARTLRMADPRLMGNLPHVTFLHAMAGDSSTAEEAIRKYETVFPDRGLSMRWTNTVWWEDPASALAHTQRMELDETYTVAPCFDAVLLELAAGTTDIQLPASCNALNPQWRARLLSRIGDVDGAYSILLELEKTRLNTQILFYPEMRNVRRDPRFMPLAQRLGLLDYWRETNQWPDFCRGSDGPYDCEKQGKFAEVSEDL